MQDVTYDKLLTTIIVILAIVMAYNTIMQAIKNHREQKALREGPISTLQKRVDNHDVLLSKDKARLDKMEADIDDFAEATRILLRQSMAVNAHMISGNDVSKLRESNDEINRYLLNR